MIILLCIIIGFVGCFLIPFHFKQYSSASRYKGDTFDLVEFDYDAMEEEAERLEAIKQEKIANLDNALIKYNRLLETLEREYKAETNEKKKAAILSKQITTLEKLNRTIEKREKLD